MIALLELPKEKYAQYCPLISKDYIDELNVKTGEMTEVEIRKFECYFIDLFEKYEENQTVFFLQIVDDERDIGYIWYDLEPEKIFISYLYILEEKRQSGYGKKALILLQELVSQKHNVSSIELHVFPSNIHARKLYESLNYKGEGDFLKLNF